MAAMGAGIKTNMRTELGKLVPVHSIGVEQMMTSGHARDSATERAVFLLYDVKSDTM
jgi:hypothetical protein